MLKFLLGVTSIAVAQAVSPTGEPSGQPTGEPTSWQGLSTYSWSGGAPATTVGASPLVVTDPIGTNKDGIIFVLDDAVTDVSYIGLFAAKSFTSHTEGATGGPITKIACTTATDPCTLPLYQGDDNLNPVPAGTWYAMAVDGTDLDFDSSINEDWGHAFEVTIQPYISAWGSTLQQDNASPDVERGDDILVTWDGLSEGDIIEYSHAGTSIVTDCSVDRYVITAADEAATRGTIALKTSGGWSTGVGFAVTGAHTIFAWQSGVADCGGVGGTTAIGVNRAVTIIESDTINVNGESSNGATTVEAGTAVTVNYYLHAASTAGTYVGLFKLGTAPDSHTVDIVAGSPRSIADLPVGISGTGSITLSTPVTTEAGSYVVMMLNRNSDTFEPIAETSWETSGETGPHVTLDAGAGAYNTDITMIAAPTGQPSGEPSGEPSGAPTAIPTSPTSEPTGIPTSSPSYIEEPWGEYVWTEKRHRKAGMCENQCSGHGTCEVNGNCKCFKGLDGEAEWTGPDCSSRTCPFDFAWVGSSINSNNLHPWAECSNKGICDRSTGECQCFTGYEGAACQRTVCPDNCNDQGTCWPEKLLASKAGRVYDAPWDAMKHVGCLCDAGYRGPACDQQECPSGADPLSGYGNEAGRDCSGRGICDYSSGICACFTGFFGTRCQHQTTVM